MLDLNRNILRMATVAALAYPIAATAEPVKLKFSFFSSDRSELYQTSIRPFVDAVNDSGKGILEIQMYFSGSISPVQAEQPQLVADGIADLAFIAPGQSPDRFSDTNVMELPGLFNDTHEASRIYTDLVAAGKLAGYQDYVTIGAFVSESESIHSRRPIGSIEDLKGLTIRTNNSTQATVLTRLGAAPSVLPINRMSAAMNDRKIDAATIPPSMVFEFGIGRVATHHYMLRLGGAPSAVIMNRRSFDALPAQAKAIIRKYSGVWLAERSASGFDALNRHIREELEFKTNRVVANPSKEDAEKAQRVFQSVVTDWAGLSEHNRDLLSAVRQALAKLRAPD